MKNKRLTIGRARDLVKRELGISPTSLVAPPELNNNPNFPYYSMNTGTRGIQVYTTGNGEGKRPNEIVVLTIVHENSCRCTHEYFYSDTLEYAADYTENRFWQDLREIIEERDINAVCNRTSKDAHKAWLVHCEKKENDSNE
jgi:hypothetical protein